MYKSRYFIIIFLLMLLSKSIYAEVTVTSSKNYQAMDEASSQTKILADKYGNYYMTFINRYSGNDQVWVYVSFDEGLSCKPLSDIGPISIVNGYDQRYPTLLVDNNNNMLYAFWVGADSEHTGTFWFDKYNKYQAGDTQLKFSYYKNGKWSTWKNIAEVDGYNTWKESPLLNEVNYSYNPVIGGKLRTVKYYQVYPSAAVDSNGNIYVVWSGPDSNFTGYQIKFIKSSDNGNTWSKWKNITRVSNKDYVSLEGTTNTMFFAQMRPKILIDSNNRIWVFYEGQDSSFQFGASKKFYQKILYIYSDDGGDTFSSPAPISSEAKIEKYVDAIEDSTGKIHVIWSGQLAVDSADNMRQIRYATISGSIVTPKNYYVSETPGFEQKNPSVTLDANDSPVVFWCGNDASHPVYEDGDPATLNINVVSNWTGLYIMESKYNSISDSWSSYKIISKGYQPSVIKGLNSKYAKFVYLFAAGPDDFRITFNSSESLILSDYSRFAKKENEEKMYLLPNPVSFRNGENIVIRYEVIQDSSEIEIGIVNTEGKKVVTIVNGVRDKNVYQVYWNGRTGDYSGYNRDTIGNYSMPLLPRGVYFIYYNINGKQKDIQKLFVR